MRRILALALFFAIHSGHTPLVAQEFDLFMESSDGPTEPFEDLAVRADIEGIVESYQFDVCHDEDVVDVTLVDFGDATEDLEYEFHSVELASDSFAVDAILADTSDSPEGVELQLYVATYELVGADGDSTSLEFCGSVFEPAAVVDGEDLTPSVESGSIVIELPNFLRGDANGDGVVVPIHDGYFLLHYFFGDGEAPGCFEAADVDNNGANSAIIDVLRLLNWAFGSASAPPDPGAEDCGSDPEGGDLGCEDPPTTCDDPADFGDPDSDYQVTVRSTVAVPGETVDVYLDLDNTGDDLIGWQWILCFDEGAFDIEEGDVVYGEDLEESTFTYSEVRLEDDHLAFGQLLSVFDDEVLAAGEDLEIFRVVFTVDDDAGGAYEVEFCDAGEPSVAEIVVLEDGSALVPELTGGTVVVGIPFRRGDIDGQGTTQALLDALYLLEWGFLSGEEPPCDDAADVDDNGIVSALVDSLFLLEFAFSQGETPAEPGPDECGADATVDDLECASPPDC